MTYIQFVCETIKNVNIGVPIYTRDIAKKMACNYYIQEDAAAYATSNAIKRIMDGNIEPQLRFYQKGIYYKAVVTPFGETSINTEQLIADKYMLPNIGYETGGSYIYQIGLTTQIPNIRTIATNIANSGSRIDRKLGVKIRPPKTKITADNKDYLQILDALEIFNIAPIEEPQARRIMAQQIKEKKLQYDKLLAFANKYYNIKAILQLANVAEYGGL